LSSFHTKPSSIENHWRTWEITPTMPLLLSCLWNLCKMQKKIKKISTNTTTTPGISQFTLLQVSALFYTFVFKVIALAL